MTDIYENLPDDPRQAFLILEAHFRSTFNSKLLTASNNLSHKIISEDYIDNTMTILNELELENELNFKIDDSKSYDINMRNLQKAINSYRIRLNLRNKFIPKTYSIAIEQSEKSKIHHYLDNIRDLVEGWKNISDLKREAIFKKLNALSAEVDLKRTRMEIICDTFLTITGTAKKAAEDLDAIKKFLDPLERLFAEHRVEQDLDKISYSEPKQIELKDTEPTTE